MSCCEVGGKAIARVTYLIKEYEVKTDMQYFIYIMEKASRCFGVKVMIEL